MRDNVDRLKQKTPQKEGKDSKGNPNLKSSKIPNNPDHQKYGSLKKFRAREGFDQGYCDAQGYQRSSSNRRVVCPKIRSRNKRTHQQIRRVCKNLNQRIRKLKPNRAGEAGELDSKINSESIEREISKALVSLVLNKAKAPKNSSLFKEVEKLKELLTIFKTSSLRGLQQLAQGKTAKVLVDTKKEIAYKLIEINDGEVGGTFPKEIRIRPEDQQILISGCKRHSLLKTLRAIEISNDHGGPLFTEVAGFTESGDLIICQPYIKNLQSIGMFDDPNSNKSIELEESIKSLGMKPLGDIGSPFAISEMKLSNSSNKKQNNKKSKTYAIFDDLHGDNVLKTQDGNVFLVDSLATRFLNESEIKMLHKFLPKKSKKIVEEIIVEAPTIN